MLKTQKTYGIVAAILALSLLLCSGCVSNEQPKEPLEQVSTQVVPKTYSTATVDDDFINNKVLVVMQPNVSHLEYDKNDFQEIKCKDILTLTDDYYIKKGANKALILTLRGHSKQNVIDAVKELEKRADVLLAEPAYEGTFAVSPRTTETTDKNEKVEYLEKVYWRHRDKKNIDYHPTHITIGIQPYARDYKYTVEDFAYVGCTEIRGDYLVGVNKRHIRITVEKAITQEEILRAIHILEQRDDVRFVEPNLMVYDSDLEANSINITPLTQTQINNIISLPEALELSTGTNTVTVGVLDSGIDITHPDLQGNVNTTLSKNFVTENEYGEDVNYSPYLDISGHGTSVAGVVNAITNDASGFSGNVKLVSLKIKHNNLFVGEEMIAAINYANEKNIDLLVCSQEVESGTALSDAIDDYAGVIVCAAGNDGHDIDFAECLPASYAKEDCDNIIAVGASDGNDNIAQFYNYNEVANEWVLGPQSNTGNASVLLFAPGSMMTVCHPQSLCLSECSLSDLNHATIGYHYKNGTSFSAPLVAGVVALMLVEHPGLTKYEIIDMITDSVDSYNALRNYCITGGRLNAEYALEATEDRGHYRHDFSYINGLKHRAYCLCGQYIEENHTYTTSGMVRTCIYCGYQVQLQNVEPEHEIE